MTILDFISFFHLEKKEFSPRIQLTVPSDLFSTIQKNITADDHIDFFCNGSRSVCVALINSGRTWIAKRGPKIVIGHVKNPHPELGVARRD